MHVPASCQRDPGTPCLLRPGRQRHATLRFPKRDGQKLAPLVRTARPQLADQLGPIQCHSRSILHAKGQSHAVELRSLGAPAVRGTGCVNCTRPGPRWTGLSNDPVSPDLPVVANLTAGIVVIATACDSTSTKGAIAGVAELVDAPDLGSGAERRGGSNPSTRTSSRNPGTSTRRDSAAARESQSHPPELAFSETESMRDAGRFHLADTFLLP